MNQCKYRFRTLSASLILLAVSGTAQTSTIPAINSIISLKAVNTNYVSAKPANTNVLIANALTVGSYESFTVVDAGNGQIALKCNGNNLYVSATLAGSSSLVASRTNIGSYEKFKFIQTNSRTALLAMINSKYVCADGAGKKPLIAKSTVIGGWENFIVTTTPPATSNRLITWCKLESIASITNPAAGPAGVITGTPLFTTGKFGTGLRIDSDIADNVLFYPFGSSKRYFGTDEFTIELWARPNGLNLDRYIFDFLRPGTNDLSYVRLRQSGSYIILHGLTNSPTGIRLPYTWATNRFDHFAVVVSKTKVSLYTNGLLAASGGIATHVLGTQMPQELVLGIEQQMLDPQKKFVGCIDNLKIYNYAKTNFTDRLTE